MPRKRTLTRICGIAVVSLIFFFICNIISLYAAGPARMKIETATLETISLALGKSLILECPVPVKRVAIAQPTIAEVMVLSPKQIYLNAKTLGSTNLTLWDSGNNVCGVLDIEVIPDVNRFKERIHKMFPGEKNVLVSASHDHLTLSGSVSSAVTSAQIMELARVYVPGDKEGQSKVINLLEVGGIQQVMLEVRVSEMSRSLARRLGINFSVLSASGQQFGLSLLNNLVQLPDEGWPGNSIKVTSNITGIINFLGDGASWTVFIDALKENGLLKVLAEPTLITLSGIEAKFLAGGEFPVPVPDSDGRVTISYKPFGVGLTFTPIVLNNNKINMRVAPEVSELDFTTAVTLQGFIVPSITTRRVATTVELADGQSFAIAGLIKEEMRESIKKFPLLGDIPILGALFSSSSYQQRDSELIVIVTPHLVKPLDMKKQTLPTEQFVEPNDFEFYLLGHTEGRGEPRSSGGVTTPVGRSDSNLEGKFGHTTPQQ